MDIALQTTAPLQAPAETPRRRVWPAILTLYVLAAIIPECVATFNTAPRAFLFNPALFFFETAFYGSSNLLIRELIRRRQRRWISLVLLGIAFGFANEGVIAGTWYTVIPDGYSLVGGVDWGWATALTAFHLIYSVLIPIGLVEALFPSVARQSWLKRKSSISFSLLLSLTILTAFFLPTYRLARLLVLLAMLILIIIAVRLPVSAPPTSLETTVIPPLRRLRVAGFFGTLLFFSAIVFVPALLLHVIVPAYRGPAQVFALLFIVWVSVMLLTRARRWIRQQVWQPQQSLALITGALLPTIILSLLLPQMWLAAQPVATLSVLALLILAARRKGKEAVTTNKI